MTTLPTDRERVLTAALSRLVVAVGTVFPSPDHPAGHPRSVASEDSIPVLME